MASDRAARVAGRIASGAWGGASGNTELARKIAAAIRRECKRAVEECAEIAEAYQHKVPADGDDEPCRIARYSNVTCQRIAAAIRARSTKRK